MDLEHRSPESTLFVDAHYQDCFGSATAVKPSSYFVIFNYNGDVIDVSPQLSSRLSLDTELLLEKRIYKQWNNYSFQDWSKVLHQIKENERVIQLPIALFDRDDVMVQFFAVASNLSLLGQNFVIATLVETDYKEENDDILPNFDALISHCTPTPQLIVNKEFEVEFATQSGLNILGLSISEIREQNLFSLIHHDDLDCWIDFVNDYKLGDCSILNLRFKLANGHFFPIDCELHTVKASESGVDYWLLVLHDASKFRRLERDLERVTREANQYRTMKDNFLSTISHELRTPLNAIIGLSTLLERNAVNNDTAWEARLINQNGYQLLGVIDSMFDYSRLESHEYKLNYERVAVNNFFNSIQSVIQTNYIGSHGNSIDIKMDVQLHETIDFIETDADFLRKIILRLIDNAIKFTHQGFVRFGCKPFGVAQYLFYVEDTGIGIPTDKQSLIFDQFTQLDQSLTRAVGGAGLGLSISQKMVELLGGKIWVISEEGNGAGFYFTLPFKHKQ